jgi:hypothetical protein
VIVLDRGNRRVALFSAEGEPLGAFGGGLYSHPARFEPGSAVAAPAAPLSASVASPAPATAPSTAPPSSDTAEALTAGGTFRVRVDPAPAELPRNEPFELRVQVLDAASRAPPAEEVELMVDAVMPEHRHGMTTRPRVEAAPDGTFLVRGMLLHMPGEWRLRIDVTRGGVTERAEITVGLE